MQKLIASFMVCCGFLSAMAQSPNFVVILTDDQAWNGSSVLLKATELGSKSDFYETPNLELLAQNGMVFSQAYAPAPRCSPSRNSILTGQSPARAGFTTVAAAGATNRPLLEGSNNTIINTAETTIAEWLKSTGLNYRTAHFGKWHLSAGGTANHGFDFGDGDTNNNDGDAANGQLIQTDPKRIFDLTTKGENFMSQAVTDGVPFYLQLSHYAVHTSLEATAANLNYFQSKTPGSRHDNASYAAMTKDLDDGIGLLVQHIATLGIANNTYVIILSDNGGQSSQTDNAPLSNGKNYITEGGVRVPMIIAGPNVAVAQCDEAVNGYDLFPTIAALSGGTSTLPASLDGKDLTPLFSQTTFERGNGLYFHSPHYGNGTKEPRSAVVDGRYKLVMAYENCDIDLYDLETDIGETMDVASSFPDITNGLLLELRDYLKNSNAQMPTLNPTFYTGTGNDLDADGLDDTWEIRNLLCYGYTGTDDPDGDGRTNEQEETDGTDPIAGVNLQVKALLQGAYNTSTNEMHPHLHSAGLLPTTGPYLGTIASSIPTNAVDWVLVKLHSTDGTYTVLEEQEAFIRNDGQVLSIDGNLNLYFDKLGQAQQALVSIHHRNHLGTLANAMVEVTKDGTIFCPISNSISTTNIGCGTPHDPANVFVNISLVGGERHIDTNDYPNHNYSVRNGTLAPTSYNFEMDATPSLAASTTSILSNTNRPRYFFGVALNGVLLAPAPAQPFIFTNPQTNQYNWDWVFEPTMNQGDGSDKVALDCASAHEGGQGYHYHGNMYEYAETLLPGLSDNSTIPTSIQQVHIAWAADGFPVLYRYGPNSSGNLVLLQPSFQIKAGERPGDGITEPCGPYNGKYTNDWEYVAGLGDLDECNGVQRTITINGETFPYFYVVTDNFPQIGRCFKGTPDVSFR
ncbi:MAG: sulfatase-like hydrolase/transferase [Bacteroidota bacterium]